MVFDIKDTGFELDDFVGGVGESGKESFRNGGVLELDERSDLGSDVASTGGDSDTELTEYAAGGVDTGGTVGAQGGTETMKGGEGMLIGRLDGYGLDVFVTKGLKHTLGVTAIGFVSDDVGADGVRREEDDGVTEGLELAGPVVSGTAGLEDDGSGMTLGEEAFEFGPRKTMVFVDVAGGMRDGDFKDGLSEVHGDGSVMRHVGLLLHEK